MAMTMAPTAKGVTCRQCGQRGYETADDPCPGICPVCLDGVLARISRRLETHMALGASPEQGLGFLASQLRRSGFTEAAVTEQVAGIIAGLAREAGA